MPRYAFFCYVLLTVPLIVGCEGCRPNSPTTADGEPIPKEAYTVGPTVSYPQDQNSGFGLAKPGHWGTAEQSLRSNQSDRRGEMSTQVSVLLQDRDLQQIGTLKSIASVRPVVLPEGQMRRLDFRYLVPLPNDSFATRVNVSSSLMADSGGVLDTGSQPLVAMGSSEYSFVVLTTRPERFTRFQTANWASFKSGSLIDEKLTINYRVIVPKADNGILPLPETFLDMTSIAVIFWDDLSQDALTPLQQLAISDWVRFGGRLIVNGAAASESIVNTSIADLLPLEPTSNIELDGEAAAEMLTNHSVKDDRSLAKQRSVLEQDSSHVAIDGRITSKAESVAGTGSLVLRQRFGRGAVVQSRFNLTDSWIMDWDSYDSFINSVFLGRPARVFSVAQGSVAYANGDSEGEPLDVHPDDLELRFSKSRNNADAAANTHLRIASRDAILKQSGPIETSTGSVFDPLSSPHPIGGLGAWNDNSDVMSVLRSTLIQEAGLEIPDSSMVVRSLLVYLVILVPVNYIVFRLMNRLEYAWFAVPVIAIIGAAWAARQAQLDIGFARSSTEVAIVEAYADYPRAHLTRLMAIYNSLSSRYTLQFATHDGAAATLSDESNPDISIEPTFRVSFDEGPAFHDFAVSSNRMRFAHTEEIIDLGGGIRIDPTTDGSGQGQLINETDLELFDAIVVRRDETGESHIAVIGAISPGEAQTIEYGPASGVSLPSDLPLDIDVIMGRLTDPVALPEDSIRLICRVDGRMDGLTITPNASQQNAQTVLLVHLQEPPLPEIEADVNLISSFARSVSPTDVTEETTGDSESNENTTESQSSN
ncbi:hypothetical protein [Rhodopirellula sp. MGV]|uniref:hypothetical protein n=1 Tax=Rhodopirellula sp. MGV TaxID=2023130 RepID=UPI000B960EEA|nr:hypothetical protein [Rhodopirellula sp. MGV]OYP33915.1 hypothetical protein CGZ80_17165 [Rhodopirellula sp. MGV]PNY34103.1 hypothetical protein C2E31_25225 [Rhodopirellula baltica]